MKPAIPLLVAVLTLPLAAFSGGNDDGGALLEASQAYATGDYARATELADLLGTPGGYRLAARARLAEGREAADPDTRLRLFEEASRAAEKAVEVDPESAEAHLYLAIALGFVGREQGGLASHFEGLADTAKRHIDVARRLEPQNPWAYATLGGWHLEIVEMGGAFGASLYGASEDAGIAAYSRALELKPDSAEIRQQFAAQLIAIGGDEAETLALDIATPDAPLDVETASARRSEADLQDLRQALIADDQGRIDALVASALGRKPTDP